MLAPQALAQTRSTPPAARPAPATAAQPIPRAVFLQNMNSDFAKMDANHDGKLTKPEIEAFLHAQAMQQIAARNRELFAQLDTNHDGQLSPAEFAQFHVQPPPSNATPMLQKFDANHDGIISLVEFRAGTLANFDRLDTDKDGVVTAAEMRAGGVIKH